MKVWMKQIASFILLLAILGAFYIMKRNNAQPVATHFSGSVQADLSERKISGRTDETLTVTLNTMGEDVSISMKDYLIGVLLGEMPSDFPLEALKAQAVAARTVAVKKMSENKTLCTNPNCCQAFVSLDQIPIRVLEAVQQTDGEVLTYDENLIDAVYFSTSGGMTEAAVDVWGNEVEYLQAVESPGEEDAPRFEETISIPIKVFRQTLKQYATEIDSALTISEPMRTAGGGVKQIQIGGVDFTGIQLREMFQLRSTNFEIEKNGFSIRFHCHGFGHRVGMSQYGARAMAEKGNDYRQILSYYYPGTEIKNSPED